MNIYLERPWFLLLIPAGLILVWVMLRPRNRVGYSQLGLFSGVRGVPLDLFQKMVLSAAAVLFGAALAQPMRYSVSTVPVYVQARDIVVCLDISGSMVHTVAGGGESFSKLAQAKNVIGDFVAARPQDRVALVSFSDRAYLEWPLTLDHSALLARLKLLRSTGGTQVGQGMIVSLEQLFLFGNNGGAVIILSDGISSLKPPEAEEVSRLIGETQPRLYWILIGDASQPLAVQFRHYIEGLGGNFYETSPQELQQVFDEISKLESSPVVYRREVTSQPSYGPILLVLAGVLMLASFLEKTKEI